MKRVTLPDFRRAWRWYLFAVLLIVLDQFSKSMVSQHLEYAHPWQLMPVLNFTLLHNTGAAFSFLSQAGGWQRWIFSTLSFVVSLLLVVWLPLQKRFLLRLALSLILAGALGNLYDRLTLGYVVDFISVHYGDWYFPAFNLADSCISVGATLLILDWLFEPKRHAS